MSHLPDHNNISLRLSEVLDDIGVNESMVLKMRRSQQLNENEQTVKLGRSIYYFGSQSEGTTTIGLHSDSEIFFSVPGYNVIQDYAEWKRGCSNLLMIQDDITPPGYCHLQLIRPDVPLPVTDILNEHCIRDAKNRILLKNTILKKMNMENGARIGPAWTTEGLSGIMDGDIVPVIPCKSWPIGARDLSNKHLGIWPTADMKANSLCFVVPVGSNVGHLEQLEWKFSTSLAERCFMFNFNITQIRCYIVLKMILKTYLHHPITSFICKTVLLHCIENTHPNVWQEINLLTCLSYCLKRLFFSILQKSCPHFVIPSNNLMAGQFSLGVKDKLLKRMRYVIESYGLVLFGIQIDGLGQQLLTKMYPAVQNVEAGEPEGTYWLQIGNFVLRNKEKKILYSPTKWLNDTIIDSAMFLLKSQFPHIWGLESCLDAAQLKITQAYGNLIQIVNSSPQQGGSHWLTLSTMKAKTKAEIKIFDSIFEPLSFPVQLVVRQLLRKDTPPKKSDKILSKFMDCVIQENGNDCGLYAIANATAEAHGIDPCTQNYNVELLRDHLIQCLEKGRLTPFPASFRTFEHPAGVKYTTYLKVFCNCSMPEDGLPAVCDTCIKQLVDMSTHISEICGRFYHYK